MDLQRKDRNNDLSLAEESYKPCFKTRFIANLYFPLLLLFFFFLTPREGGDPPRDPRCLKFIRDRRVFRVYTSVWAVNGPTKTA